MRDSSRLPHTSNDIKRVMWEKKQSVNMQHISVANNFVTILPGLLVH